MSMSGCGSPSVDEAILNTPATQVSPCEWTDSCDVGDFPPIPVPSTARYLDTGEPVGTEDAVEAGEAEDFPLALEVPSWTFDELKGWYDAQMPPDAPFVNYQPCEVTEGDVLMLSSSQGRQDQNLDASTFDSLEQTYSGGEPLVAEEDSGTFDEGMISGFIDEPVETRTWADIKTDDFYSYQYVVANQISVSLGDGPLPQILLEATSYPVGNDSYETRPGFNFDADDREDPTAFVKSDMNYVPDSVSPECESQSPPIP